MRILNHNLRVGLSFSENVFFLFSSIKTWNMLFISPWNILFFFLRYLDFCPDFFGHVHVGKWFDKKTKGWFQNLWCHDLGKQIIIIHILLNISRSKYNQTIKFGQLTENNIKIFFIRNHAENEARKLIPDLFLVF